jgi:hypothetical protein
LKKEGRRRKRRKEMREITGELRALGHDLNGGKQLVWM